MTHSFIKITISSIILLLFISPIHPAFAQSSGEKSPSEPPSTITEKPTILTLQVIMQAINGLKHELADKEKELKETKTEDQRAIIVNEIKSFREQIESFEKDFEKISTGVDLDVFYSKPSKHFEWKDEVQEILGPIIQELKNMTEKPRQIDKLRTDIAHEDNRIHIVRKAISNIEYLINLTQNSKLIESLKEVQKDWSSKEQQISNQLTVLNYQLDEKLKERKSVLESTQVLLKAFFKSRGKNLLFSVFAFILVFVLLRWIHRLMYQFTPLSRMEKRSFYVRAADVAYHSLTIIGSSIASLLILYVSGDWVLLTLVVIFLVGIIWTTRHGILRFWDQIKLLLNLGTVRENERLIYKGIAWKVVSLNIYTHLENPVLSIGRIRLPLRDMINMTSRPFLENEPWFPCKIHDWVILSDGVHGKVISQTPEMVQLVLLGGCHKTYLTEEFLKLNPANISTDFRLKVTFGIDYIHQAICTTEIPAQLTEILVEKLTEEGYGNDILRLKVEFKTAGPSSLDYEVLADFSGRAAQLYDTLIRTIQRICVDACNKYGWIIPFPQITVHSTATGSSSLCQKKSN